MNASQQIEPAILPATNASHRVPIVCAALTSVLAIVLRCLPASDSLWVDELHTAWTVSDSVRDVFPRAAAGNQAPAFFLITWFCQATGRLGLPAEWALRLPSVLAGVALVPGSYLLARNFFNCQISGLAAAMLVAVDPNLIFFATEARPYALIQLLALLQLAIFARLVTSSPRDSLPMVLRVTFVVLSVALFYCHYTSLIFTVALLLAYPAVLLASPVLVHSRCRPIAYRLSMLVIDASLIALLCLPATRHLQSIAARRENWSTFIATPSPYEFLLLMNWTFYWLIPLGLALTGWMVGRLGVRAEPVRSRAGPAAPHFLILVVVATVPLAIALLTTNSTIAALFHRRYLIAAAVPTILCSAGLLILIPGRQLRIASAGVLVACLVWQGGILPRFQRTGRIITDRQEDWRGAVRFLAGRTSGERCTVFVGSGLIEADAWSTSDQPLHRHYCTLPLRGIYRLHDPAPELLPLPSPAAATFAESIQPLLATDQAWFIVRGRRRAAATQQRVAEICRAKGVSLKWSTHRQFEQVVVLRLRLP